MKLYIFILLFLLTGCMVDNKTENSSNFDDFTEYNSENLSQNSLEITGTGRIIANSVFKSTRTNAHVLLQGQFLSSESYLILHLFFDDFEKDTGIQLKVKPDLENESIIIEYAEPLRPYRPLATIQKSSS